MQIGTPIGESAPLLPPHVCSIDGTGKTILLLCTKIELHIFLPSPLGNAGACFCFEQPPRLAYEGLRDAGPLISIVSLTHFCCSQKAAPGVAGPRLQPCGLQTPTPCPGSPQDTGRSPQDPHGLCRRGDGSCLRTGDSQGTPLPQSRHQSEVFHKGQK